MKLNVLNIRLLTLVMILLLIHLDGFAVWVITEESNDSYGNKSIQTTFIQNNVIRYETSTSIVIIDLSLKTITIVFSQYKVYWVGTSDELNSSTISYYDMQMEKMLAGLPKHQQKELDSIYSNLKQKMLNPSKPKLPNNFLMIETDSIQEINGFNAVRYDVFVDSILTELLWHTTQVNPYADINIDEMLAFMQQLNYSSEFSSNVQSHDYLSLLKSGLLLKSVEFLPNKNKIETKVSKIREVDIVSEFFKPPTNYRKVSLFDALYLLPNSDLQEGGYGK